MRKQHLVKSTPRNEPNKRKHDDGPTPEQMESRRRHYETVKEARVQTECRSHMRGRCIHGVKCTALHVIPDAEIMCNSTVMPGQRASVNNKSYGFCRLREAKIPSHCRLPPTGKSFSTHG